MKRVWLGLALAAGAALLPAAAWARADNGKSSNIRNYQAQASPALRERAAAPVVQDYEPNPAIWLLADEDTQIYLFGTFHQLPEGFRWRSAEFDLIAAEVDELVLESSDEDEATSGDAILDQLIATIDQRPRVSERMSPESAAKWLQIGEELGLPGDYFDRLPPILALFTLAWGGLADMGRGRENGVETVLTAEFTAAGKPIGSIESSGDVLTSLIALDDGPLIGELDRDLAKWDGTTLESLVESFEDAAAEAGAEFDLYAEEHKWAQGKPVQVDFDPESAFSQALMSLLLDKRNRAWAGWLDERLKSPGTILVAVGAGHFAGDSSVLAMLAERGLTARRIN